MKHCKQAMNDIGATFSPQDEIDRRNSIHAKINGIKKRQAVFKSKVTRFRASNIEDCREGYRKLNREIIKLEAQL